MIDKKKKNKITIFVITYHIANYEWKYVLIFYLYYLLNKRGQHVLNRTKFILQYWEVDSIPLQRHKSHGPLKKKKKTQVTLADTHGSLVEQKKTTRAEEKKNYFTILTSWQYTFTKTQVTRSSKKIKLNKN